MEEINEIIEWNNYIFHINNDEFEDYTINIKIKDKTLPHDFFVFKLKLKALWIREDENYIIGDFYQDVMNKETMVEVNNKISYASLTHDFLIENADKFNFIKNVYSSSLISNKYEAWTPSISSRNFWTKQLEKSPSIPVDFIDEIQRYILKLNN